MASLANGRSEVDAVCRMQPREGSFGPLARSHLRHQARAPAARSAKSARPFSLLARSTTRRGLGAVGARSEKGRALFSTFGFWHLALRERELGLGLLVATSF